MELAVNVKQLLYSEHHRVVVVGKSNWMELWVNPIHGSGIGNLINIGIVPEMEEKGAGTRVQIR